MTEIQGKSILVRVSEGSSYRDSTVFTNMVMFTSAYIEHLLNEIL